MCFGYLICAMAAGLAWTGVSEIWRSRGVRPVPSYDRLLAFLRFVLRFYLLYMMIGYGAAKIFCSQFPPISDGQLEGKYGDSSPMGVLWRFMQASQPYTIATGLVEFGCGLLLISRRTTLLGALCSAGATLQVFLLNMCYDVPVKLLSGHLLLISLTLIAPDAKRLFSWFLLGRAVGPPFRGSLFGGFWRVDLVARLLGTVVFATFAGLTLFQAYQEAVARGIFAPDNPLMGRWVAVEFVRDGKNVSFPAQPENPPPQALPPATWQGGPGMPAVIRANIGPTWMAVKFEDGSGSSYLNVSEDPTELVLLNFKDRRPVAQLSVRFADDDRVTLEGPFDGQDVRVSLRRIPKPKKEYVFRSRKFQWVQEKPFNP
jgi:hypothetical protein